MKISIIGYSGSGKSTLARELGDKYHLPVLHLDQVHWLPGWNERSESEEESLMREFLDHNESWVIDGNYSNMEYERRLQEADLIILLLFGRMTCLRRVFGRWLKYKGSARPDMCEGCNEKFDLAFMRWILFDSRAEKRRNSFASIYRKWEDKAVLFKNQAELNRWKRACSGLRENGIPKLGRLM